MNAKQQNDKTMTIKHILTLCFTFTLYLGGLPIQKAYSLDYNYCNTPAVHPACTVAYEILKRQTSPQTGKLLFDNGIHFLDNGELFMYPGIYIAQTDLDGDGFYEIIAKPSEDTEEMAGLFCESSTRCPHYIIQDRNPDPDNIKVQFFHVMGPIFSSGIGPSTDEVFGGYKSLRAYKDHSFKKFDVYQYDRKSDDYFNITVPE